MAKTKSPVVTKAKATKLQIQNIQPNYKFGFSDIDISVFKTAKGLSEEVVRAISADKNEPEWMLTRRLKALKYFNARPLPTWGPDLSELNFDEMYYYIKPVEKQSRTWDDVPESIKQTFEKIGVPEAERKFLAGVNSQYDSNTVYHSIQENLSKQGVIFTDTDSALRDHPELFKKYFGSVVPANDNKFAALNTACWSGGSFIYVPKNVKIDLPLQAYFRMNQESSGQFERTLIIVDEGAEVSYFEGCHLAGAKVRVWNGEKNIEDIEKGNLVLTHTGQFKKVLKTMKRNHVGEIYHLKFRGESYRNLWVTPEHPFFVTKRDNPKDEHNKIFEGQWIEAKELNLNDYLAVPINIKAEVENIKEINFHQDATESIPILEEVVRIGNRYNSREETIQIPLTPENCRLMGLYIAEGTVSVNTYYINFDYHLNEIELQEFTKKSFANLFGLKANVIDYPDRLGRSVRFSSVRAARFFSQSFGRLTAELHIPDWAFSLPQAQKAALIKGVYEGDGSYDKGKNMHRISQTNQQVAQQLRGLLLSLGIRASLSKSMRAAPRQPIWQVCIALKDNDAFEAIVLGKSISSRRIPNAHTVINNGYCWMPISSIEKVVVSAPVYNLSVEDDESYIAEGVVSHNCSAPVYSEDSLHSAIVEIIAHPYSTVKYLTIQNWSENVYNLVTKRALAHHDSNVTWVDFNIGAKITQKYPSIYCHSNVTANILSAAMASSGKQHQDTGGKLFCIGENVKGTINSRSISLGGGRSSYRGHVKVFPKARNAHLAIRCDALLIDEESQSDTYPYMDVNNSEITIEHEASVSKVSEEQLYYLQTRGMTEEEAKSMIVTGFFEPFIKELPMEYAVEMNRILAISMEGSIG